MTTSPPNPTRRQFLKLAAAAGVLALPPVGLGYKLYGDAQGQPPPHLSPYVQTAMLDTWPGDAAAPPPILLLVNEHSDNPFGLYLAEILRAEGLNCFQVARLAALASIPLESVDLLLLAEGPLDAASAERLTRYVADGGCLVAMRPDVQLAPVCGLKRAPGSTTEGYIQVAASHPVAAGIAADSLQFHGTADHYELDGAQAIAWIASNAEATDFPAVSIHPYGQGQAALWAYDLARSIVYTRQGNPAWANLERDGGLGVRVADMFKDWLDLRRIHIPQADEQQRLLANVLSAMSQRKRPLPRLWYFPGNADSVFIATGDSHIPHFAPIEDVLAQVEERGGHMSIYYAPQLLSHTRRTLSRVRYWATGLPLAGEAFVRQFAGVYPGRVARWQERGHEFALHPYVGQEGTCARYAEDGTLATPTLAESWRRHWQEFTGLGFGSTSVTLRTHCVLWTGWVESARIQAAYGVRMNLDYYHWGPSFRLETGEWVYGHLTGSGLPMRFVDEQGRILNNYQQLTQLADDHLLDATFGGQMWGGQARLSGAAAVAVSEAVLQGSAENHCAVAANFHPDLFLLHPLAADEPTYASARRWLQGTLDAAASLGMPIWSAAEWLHFTEAKHDAQVDAVDWQPDAQRLSFQVSAGATPTGELTLMIPLRHGDAALGGIQVDGQAAAHQVRTVGGVQYGCVPVAAGVHQAMASYVERVG